MRNVLTVGVLVVAVNLMIACGGGGGGGSGDGGAVSGGGNFSTGGGTPERVAIDNYVNNFIVPTLQSLAQAAATLDEAAQNFAAAPNDANLTAVRSAWVAARVPWENSETALFGPVDFYGFDPAMDTWPLNQTDLNSVLASGTALNETTVGNFENSLKGFHVIEYLIFGDRSDKAVSQFTEREYEYLVASSGALRNVATSLYNAWVSNYNGQAPYAEEVVRAGQGSTAFPSEVSAIEQFVRGISIICDEVANGKIADPFDTRDPNIVESQFSFNSLNDFSNNIRGAQEAYLNSISSLVSAENAGLDERVKNAFNTAIAAIQAIPGPFRDAITNSANDGAIRSAQQAIRNVQNLMEGEVLPLILS